MAAQINQIIGQMNFEYIRDLIGDILKDEFNRQIELNTTALQAELAKAEIDRDLALIELYNLNLEALPSVVWVERFIRPTSDELLDGVMVNVITVNVPGDVSQSSGQQTSSSRFVIEAHAGARADKTGSQLLSDKKAFLKLHRVLAIANQIMNYPKYRFLGNDTEEVKFIGSSYSNDFLFDQPEYGAETSDMSVRGKIDVNVKHGEVKLNVPGIELVQNKTIIKLYDTEKGYYLEYNKQE